MLLLNNRLTRPSKLLKNQILEKPYHVGVYLLKFVFSRVKGLKAFWALYKRLWLWGIQDMRFGIPSLSLIE